MSSERRSQRIKDLAATKRATGGLVAVVGGADIAQATKGSGTVGTKAESKTKESTRKGPAQKPAPSRQSPTSKSTANKSAGSTREESRGTQDARPGKRRQTKAHSDDGVDHVEAMSTVDGKQTATTPDAAAPVSDEG